MVFAEQIGDIPVMQYIDKGHAHIGDKLENAVESIELAKDLLLSVQTIKDEDFKALIIRDLVQGIRILEKWKREAETGEEEEIEDNGFNLEREQAELLEVSNRLGLSPAIMDRAYGILKRTLHTKDEIEEILKGIDEEEGDNEKQA